MKKLINLVIKINFLSYDIDLVNFTTASAIFHFYRQSVSREPR